MTESTNAQRLADEYGRAYATAHLEATYGTSKSYTKERVREANEARELLTAELLRLEAANAELLEALRMNAQALSWLAFGECRGFTDNLPTALEATGAARAAIKKHGGSA